jgi:hypothetical protein
VVEANMVSVFAVVELETFNLDPRPWPRRHRAPRAICRFTVPRQPADMVRIMALRGKHM